jgi:putative modified peptide
MRRFRQGWAGDSDIVAVYGATAIRKRTTTRGNTMPFKLSEDTVDTLLDKLATDDDFRATFSKNPRAALASVGHKPSADPGVAEGAWTCLAVSQLASKEAIKASRDALRQQLLSAKSGHSPISLEVKKA